MILGTVQARDDWEGLSLVIDGEDEPTTKKYHYLQSYVPRAGDRVLIADVGDSYVVIGRIISFYSNAGKARTAESADSADTATTATRATNATNATNATYANYMKGYSGGSDIQFTYFNGDLWAKMGSTQFALAKK